MQLNIDRAALLLFVTIFGGLLLTGCTEAGAASADSSPGKAQLAGVAAAAPAAPAAEPLSSCCAGEESGPGGHHGSGDKDKSGKQSGAGKSGAGDPYPLATCPVTGEVLGSMGEPVVYDFNGREIRFCCQGCIKQFTANPAKYIPNIDKQINSLQQPSYPLGTCVVSGDKLGEMGAPVDFVYNNRLFRLCCGGCKKDIIKESAKYFARLDAAVIKAQAQDYPLSTCVVTGEQLGSKGTPVDYVFGTDLVRFCCGGCIRDFEADPAKYMAKIK